MKKILIGGAWPYANGSLHIGHIAALLPGDVLARYFRQKGHDVYYISGSDCHGTPVTIRAAQENSTPQEVSDRFHEEFVSVFEKLGFSYDKYGKTSGDEHKEFVRSFHERMYKYAYIKEKIAPAAWCEHCKKAPSDRMVIGKCPYCGEETRGDQCEACGAVLEAENLIDPVCADCSNPVTTKLSKQLILDLPRLEEKIRTYLEKHTHWRKNALAFTKRYLDEGLRERAVTRALNWGIDVPKAGYEDKKIYIWTENVLGYLSQSFALAKERGVDPKELWGEDADTVHYYVHGKDNIPFHTIILPALMFASECFWHKPDEIISSEYLTLEGKRISTSRNWAIWAGDIVQRYDPDSLRYFFIANGPEKRDTDFSWREFVERTNGELLGAYGNFVNRTLAFAVKYFDGKIKPCDPERELVNRVSAAYEKTGGLIGEGRFKEALEGLMELTRFANRYYDAKTPWITRTSDFEECERTIANCAYLCLNLACLFKPFLPFSSEKVLSWLWGNDSWEEKRIEREIKLEKIDILFRRLDKDTIDIETKKLETTAYRV